MLGVVLGVGSWLPLLVFPGKADAILPWHQRYIVKANVWFGVVNFIGNYFWTHYFYVLLGCSYSFKTTIFLNRVPLFLYGMTQSYFSLYFLLANILYRVVRQTAVTNTGRAIFTIIITVVLSWFLAFMETWTIESVPYYSFIDRSSMYRIGTTFYALYFLPTFPLFVLLDEKRGENRSLWDAAIEALGASMIAFLLCDFWRLAMNNTGYLPFLVSS